MEIEICECGKIKKTKTVFCSLHDIKWPDGRTSGRGKVEKRRVFYCSECEPEPSDKMVVPEPGSQFEKLTTN